MTCRMRCGTTRGWQEMKDLRKKLENLKELRDLIKKLGRASGKGPKRRAPQEVRLMLTIFKCCDRPDEASHGVLTVVPLLST